MSPRAAIAAFIANCDFGWFSHFLHRAEPPDEVDFWQPSPHGFKAIPPGSPGSNGFAEMTARTRGDPAAVRGAAAVL